jgi:hypothetical protein
MAVLSHKRQAHAYHDRAEECRRLARMGPADMKASYLRMAEAYEQMAKDEESAPPRDFSAAKLFGIRFFCF